MNETEIERLMQFVKEADWIQETKQSLDKAIHKFEREAYELMPLLYAESVKNDMTEIFDNKTKQWWENDEKYHLGCNLCEMKAVEVAKRLLEDA